MIRLPLAPLLVLLTASLLGSPIRADPLGRLPDFQGFALGDTLDEVRRKGHPDKGSGDDIQFVCTGDPLAKETGLDFRPEGDTEKIGVKFCQFVKAPESDSTSRKWETVSLKFGRHKLQGGFSFTPKTNDPETSERLYRIGIFIRPPVFDDLASALRSRYGVPNDETIESIRLPSGARRDAKSLIWIGARYGIALIEQINDQEFGGLDLVDDETNKALERQAKDASATGAVPPPAAAPTGMGPTGTDKGLPSPFGLRGFNLGTTLGEIRRQKHPDLNLAELVCTGDPRATEQFGLTPSEHYRAIGVKTCRFFIFRKSNGDVLEVPMDVDGHSARAIFLFTPSSWPPSTADRLFRIRVVADPAQFDGLFGALQARFGKPGIDEMIPQEISKRLRRMLIWEDSQSKLLVSEPMPSASGGRTIIAYIDVPLEDAVEKAIEATKKRSGASKP